jgi:hypothetical protein
MSKPIWRYSVTFGLSGCYMPDYHGGAHCGTTRRELVDLIKGEIDMLDLPASLIRDVKINRLWSFIERNGSSSAHFNLHHGANVLSFHGLTEEEYQQQSESDN